MVAEHPDTKSHSGENGSCATHTTTTTKEQNGAASETPAAEGPGCQVAPPTPPDGGYGWVIMFASFICNVIVDGVCFSVGIFYLEFLQQYGESKSKTSLVGSVLNGMYLSMGPIVSALANRFGCRNVAITGSLVASLAFVISIFSPNIDVLILTYGALGGAGFGLMYLPAIVMVGFYFEKRRAFATGVAVCGSGIGAFVFAPLTERLITYYGWKGATLIVGGITLNGVVMGALFRPLEATCSNSVEKPVETAVAEEQCNGAVTTEKPGLNHMNKENNEDYNNSDSEKNPKLLLSVPAINGKIEPKDLLKSKMAVSVERFLQKNPDHTGYAANGQSKAFIHSMHDLSPDSPNTPSNGLINRQFSKSMDHILHAGSCQDSVKRARDISRPMYRKDIFYSGSIMNLQEYQREGGSYTQSVTSIPRSSSGNASRSDSQSNSACTSLVDTFREMMDFSLFLNPVFTIYGISCFLCMTGFFVPFMYLPADAILKGVARENAAFLLSIIGIANTIARVLCGWVSDQPWADCLLINNLALIMGGVATMLSPFCGTYALLATYAAVFGVAIAVFVSLRSILMVELIGLDRLTNAFGLVTLCQGLSSFIGAPIAGAIFDVTGNYAVSFYFAGSTLLLAGLICLPLRRISNWRKRKLLQNNLQENGSLLEVETTA